MADLPNATSPGPRSPVIRVIDCHVARPGERGEWEFLLLRRASNKLYANTWRMVGGKIDAGESAWRTCLRELREETGLRPQRLLSVPCINRFYEWQADRINDIPVFVAVVDSGATPELDEEHRHFEWLQVGPAIARLPWPGQRDGLRAAAALLQDDGPLPGFLEVDITAEFVTP